MVIKPNKPRFLKTNLAIISFLLLSLLLSCSEATSNPSSTPPPTPSPTQTTQHAVTFNTSGGSVVASQVVEDGEIVKKPVPDPTRTDYTFEGWYKEESFKNVFNFNNTPINADTIIYAKWDVPSMSIIETIRNIKTTKKVNLFNINTALYDRKGNKIKNKGAPLAYSKIFPTVDQTVTLYENESGYSTAFSVSIALANVTGGHGFNVNKDRGAPYFLFVLDNKIYLDDDHYIQLTFDREQTYMKEADGSIWEIPSGSSALLTWGLESKTAPAHELNGYAGYRFTSFPPQTTNTNSSIKLRCQVTSSGYVAGNNYTLQLTLKQKLISPDGETQLENHVIQKTFTTAVESGVTSRFRNYSPDIFFQTNKTHFPY